MKILLSGLLFLLGLFAVGYAEPATVDFSAEESRRVVISPGSAIGEQRDVATLRLADGKTILSAWTRGAEKSLGALKRSEDGGRTWSELVPTPANWATVRQAPSMHRLTDPRGVTRLFVFGQGLDGTMQQAFSTDRGRTWTPMTSNGLRGLGTFTAILPVDGGKKLVAFSQILRPVSARDNTAGGIAQSESVDGGLTWAPWRQAFDDGKHAGALVGPEILRLPDGRRWACLFGDRTRRGGAYFLTSDDEGRSWSAARPLPAAVQGEQYQAQISTDGRLVLVFRDRGTNDQPRNQIVAWVGRYEDLLDGHAKGYQIALFPEQPPTVTEASPLEILPDDTLVVTTCLALRPGVEKAAVVSLRFALPDPDDASSEEQKFGPPIDARWAGLIVDDESAKLSGKWARSAKHNALIGPSYRHDEGQANGLVSATFAPVITTAGRYEVRLLYPATPKRASNAEVTVSGAGRKFIELVDLRVECLRDGLARSLGTFEFAAGNQGAVTISNVGADGVVAVDAVQFVPASLAVQERAGQSVERAPDNAERFGPPSPEPEWAALRTRRAAAVAFSPLAETITPTVISAIPPEPVQLARDTSAAEVDGRNFDLVVIGGTGGGVICATRAAREGLSVLLVQHNRHLGGMMTNSLMQWDAVYGGPRAPLFSELLRNIEAYYVAKFGRDSAEHQVMRYTHEHSPIGWVEPQVAEREFNRLVAQESKITVLLGHYPIAVERAGASLQSVTLRAREGAGEIRVRGNAFVDATYEGDFLAVAKVPSRIGREARSEFDEPHAGVLFTNVEKGRAPVDAIQGLLNIRPTNNRQAEIDESSPGTADQAVQAYNFRFCVSNDPENRLPLEDPPPGYRREDYLSFDRKFLTDRVGPNRKSQVNSAVLPGANLAYPEADWATREKITLQHQDFALGLMWFLQNDESVPREWRAEFRQWGLPKDEYEDHEHLPYELYVREARRLVGRFILTEHDALSAPELARAPLHADSIAVTDWYLDSHACTTQDRPGFDYDGKLTLTEETRPAQIPYRALLPQEVDNLLVPVCLSATHVAWGAVRLEPVWMQTGEAAGLAAALAQRERTTVANLSPDLLLRTLVERRQLVTFFNDVKVDGPEPWIPAAQYFGTKGFFAGYEARLEQPLTKAIASQWVRTFAALRAGTLDPMAAARGVAQAGETGAPATAAVLTQLLTEAHLPAPSIAQIIKVLNSPGRVPLSRGAVCQALYLALKP